MELSTKLKGFTEVLKQWEQNNCTSQSARELTVQQVKALKYIVEDDNLWKKFINIFRNGREYDSWLAVDWPAGFDELVLCAPLCKLVEWECSKCHVGIRQSNYSCANENSLFGYIAVLLQLENRELLFQHLNKITNLLESDNVYWNLKGLDIYIRPLKPA